jgi:hypothetical protein
MAIHRLKTWPAYFEAIRQHTKGFELRKDDRGFEVGDLLILEEYDPSREHYTGQIEERLVTFIVRQSSSFL